MLFFRKYVVAQSVSFKSWCNAPCNKATVSFYFLRSFKEVIGTCPQFFETFYSDKNVQIPFRDKLCFKLPLRKQEWTFIHIIYHFNTVQQILILCITQSQSHKHYADKNYASPLQSSIMAHIVSYQKNQAAKQATPLSKFPHSAPTGNTWPETTVVSMPLAPSSKLNKNEIAAQKNLIRIKLYLNSTLHHLQRSH